MIDLVKIIKSNSFLSAFKKAYRLNRNIEDIKLESGFLVQIKPKGNDFEIKINKPIDGNYFGVDLGEDFRFEHCGLPIGEKGEGFYLDEGFYNLISVHFHILDSTSIYSEGDITAFYEARQQNIERAKENNLDYFINPLFIVANKITYPKELELGFYIFIDAKSQKEFSLYHLFLTLKSVKDLQKEAKKLKNISAYLIQPL
jgi:hypothetical protein